MNFDEKYIDELIEIRKQARELKDWKLSDEIRNYLDTKYVFIFDTKGNDGKPFQEVHFCPQKPFDEGKAWLEQRMVYKKQELESSLQGALAEEDFKKCAELRDQISKIQLSYTNRQYLEYQIQQDIRAEKLFEAWLYSVRSSIK